MFAYGNAILPAPVGGDNFIIAMKKDQRNSRLESIKKFISADLDEYDSLCLLFCRGNISGLTVYIIRHIAISLQYSPVRM